MLEKNSGFLPLSQKSRTISGGIPLQAAGRLLSGGWILAA